MIHNSKGLSFGWGDGTGYGNGSGRGNGDGDRLNKLAHISTGQINIHRIDTRIIR